MREIKFKAWDKTNKQWFMEGAAFDLKYSGRCGDFYFDNDHPCNMRQVDLEWVQFIGLTDKNCEEIYRGAILNFGDYSDGSGPCNHEVVWSERNACFRTREIATNMFCSCVDNYSTVIGNIYENPELLEGK